MHKDIKHFLQKTHEKLKEFKGKIDDLKTPKETETVVIPPKQEKIEKIQITASAGTMAKFFAIGILLILLVLFAYEVRDILVIFFVALLFAAALDPMIDSLERRRIPRSVGVILIYLVVFTVLGLLISNVVPIIAHEVGQLASRAQDFLVNIVNGNLELPTFLEKYRPYIQRLFTGLDISKAASYKDLILQFANRLSGFAGNIFGAILFVFNGFFNFIIVLVLTFLMTVDESGIDKFILSLFPSRYAEYINKKSYAIKEKMGYWLRGQVILCIIVGLLVYIGFLIIGLATGKSVEYAATIALVAGFTELIPYAGPFIAWLIALPIVANQSLGLIVWMTGLMYLVQVLENNLIVPVVMKRAVGISPIFIMFAMFVGFSFLGMLGIILSVPAATAVALFVKDYAEKEK